MFLEGRMGGESAGSFSSEDERERVKRVPENEQALLVS